MIFDYDWKLEVNYEELTELEEENARLMEEERKNKSEKSAQPMHLSKISQPLYHREDLKMQKERLQEILESHKKWLRGKDGKRADLRCADLRGIDLRCADLRCADLGYADLRYADLRGADLDYSSFPLWCGSFDIIVDERLIRQLCYHIAKLKYAGNDSDIKTLLESDVLKSVANKFHRVEECGQFRCD